MDPLNSKGGLSKHVNGKKLIPLWGLVVLIHVALVVALFSGPSWLPKWTGGGRASCELKQSFEARPSNAILEQEVKPSIIQTQPSNKGNGSATENAQEVIENEEDSDHKNESATENSQGVTENAQEVRGNEDDFDGKNESVTDNSQEVIEKAQEVIENEQDFNSKELVSETAMCDFTKGRWVENPEGPLYTNMTCPYIQDDQDCMKNGHPGLETLTLRWKPDDCSLPRFDGAQFLETFRGKVWAFVGDSLARNQMQSLLCLLAQVEEPKNTFHDRPKVNVHWHFESYNFTLIVLWSPYLVQYTEKEFMGMRSGVLKLQLDVVDSYWVGFLKDMDMIVLSTAHWLMKPAVYIVGNEVVGCYGCQPWMKEMNMKHVEFTYAFQMVIRSSMELIGSRSDFKGTAFVRTYSVGHFENGNWDTGGTCNRSMPYKSEDEIQLSPHTLHNKNELYRIMMEEVKKANDKYNNTIEDTSSPKFRLLDITRMSILRPDGHPGIFRGHSHFVDAQPGKKVPNDCLHWCLPGPIDAWNEILYQLMKDNS